MARAAGSLIQSRPKRRARPTIQPTFQVGRGAGQWSQRFEGGRFRARHPSMARPSWLVPANPWKTTLLSALTLAQTRILLRAAAEPERLGARSGWQSGLRQRRIRCCFRRPSPVEIGGAYCPLNSDRGLGRVRLARNPALILIECTHRRVLPAHAVERHVILLERAHGEIVG